MVAKAQTDESSLIATMLLLLVVVVVRIENVFYNGRITHETTIPWVLCQPSV
jgi:hypothetical protein